MAVAVIIDVPNGNQQFYDQIVPALFSNGRLPEGWQLHIAGPTETGWRIVNVVPSQQEFEEFARAAGPSPATTGGRNTRFDVLPCLQPDESLNKWNSESRPRAADVIVTMGRGQGQRHGRRPPESRTPPATPQRRPATPVKRALIGLFVSGCQLAGTSTPRRLVGRLTRRPLGDARRWGCGRSCTVAVRRASAMVTVPVGWRRP